MGKYFFRMENPILVVFYSFFGSKLVTIKKEISDNNGCILVSQVKIDEEIYFLVNLHNWNIESEQLESFI